MTTVWPVMVSVRHMVTTMPAQSPSSAGFFSSELGAERSICSGLRLAVARVPSRRPGATQLTSVAGASIGISRSHGARRLIPAAMSGLLRSLATSVRSGHMPAMSVVVVVIIVVVGKPLEHRTRPDGSRMRTADGHPGINSLARSKGQ